MVNAIGKLYPGEATVSAEDISPGADGGRFELNHNCARPATPSPSRRRNDGRHYEYNNEIRAPGPPCPPSAGSNRGPNSMDNNSTAVTITVDPTGPSEPSIDSGQTEYTPKVQQHVRFMPSSLTVAASSSTDVPVGQSAGFEVSKIAGQTINTTPHDMLQLIDVEIGLMPENVPQRSRLRGGFGRRSPMGGGFSILAQCMYCLLIFALILLIFSGVTMLLPIARALLVTLVWVFFGTGFGLLCCVCCLVCAVIDAVPMDDLERPRRSLPFNFGRYMDTAPKIRRKRKDNHYVDGGDASVLGSSAPRDDVTPPSDEKSGEYPEADGGRGRRGQNCSIPAIMAIEDDHYSNRRRTPSRSRSRRQRRQDDAGDASRQRAADLVSDESVEFYDEEADRRGQQGRSRSPHPR